jgi:RNA-directed DNA polymerase
MVTNAQNHTGRRYVLNIDLLDFFPRITRKRIYGRLVAAPYSLNSNVANLIAALATNAYARLPQGSPSSPVIANIVAAELDADLASLCGSLGCRYTRYADDITISTSRTELSPEIARYPNAQGTGQVIIGDRLTDIIERHRFRINDRKSRLQSYWTRQMCTGLVVNSSHITPPRAYIRRLRSLVDHWQKKGWQDAAQVLHTSENRPLFDNRDRLVNHVLGKIAYMKMVRGQNDPISLRLEHIVASLPPNH